MRTACLVVLAAGLMLLAVPGFAHHGTGVSYDASKPVTLKAIVTEFRYANPHPQLYFDVTDEAIQVRQTRSRSSEAQSCEVSSEL